MPSEFRCPACHSEDIIDHGELIECRGCGLEFFKEFIGSEINEENLLSEQELKAFTETFDELKDDEKRKKVIKSLKDDLH